MISVGNFGRALLAGAAGLIVLAPFVATAQAPSQQFQPPTPQVQQNPVCARLETQLASVERGGGAGSRATIVRGAEDAANRQQAEVDRLATQHRRAGCISAGIFSIFTPQPPQCQALNSQIDQARGQLDRLMSELQRAQSGGGNDMESQRQNILVQLAQNNCGPQYRAAAAAPQRGIFDSIFGGSSGAGSYGGTEVSSGGSFRTLCVRSCDGYYYPISFSTNPSHFADDENTCRNTCPNTEVALYSHRTNEDVRLAATVQGKRYVDLPNAFRYRQQFDASCSCRKPGQSWAEAVGQSSDRLGRGDILVTDEKAKELSTPVQPRGSRPPAATPAAGQLPSPAATRQPQRRRVVQGPYVLSAQARGQRANILRSLLNNRTLRFSRWPLARAIHPAVTAACPGRGND